MDRIRPTHEVVFELVEECIATTERLCGLLGDRDAG
jgi:hypothetical protein